MQDDKQRRWNRLVIGTVVAGVALVALVGCGGDDGGGYLITGLLGRTAWSQAAHISLRSLKGAVPGGVENVGRVDHQ